MVIKMVVLAVVSDRLLRAFQDDGCISNRHTFSRNRDDDDDDDDDDEETAAATAVVVEVSNRKSLQYL